MDENLLAHYAKPVPRYTSYPTAPHFSAAVGNSDYSGWLRALKLETRVSLYVHIPFCDRLCWFCGCNTKQTHRYAPIKSYLPSLYEEIERVSDLLAGRARISALHFGGGSPTMLEPDDTRAVNALLREKFEFLDDAEISIEIDPNDMDEARHDALADIGLTRASLGLQDFDPKVQKAINRLQTYEQTKEVVDAVRVRGCRSVNTDVLYGLPHQSEETIATTIRKTLLLRPDRIALFGYAHVPWIKKHQTMIDEAVLPDVKARFAQQTLAAKMLVEAGYQAIGIDHFALPSDSMAIAANNGTLRRNFQGYTVDGAEALIGLGGSSIGQLPQGYVQNATGTGEYKAKVADGDLAVARGYALSEDDRVRGYVIERLMCDFAFSAVSLREKFGDAAQTVLEDAEALVASEPSQFFVATEDGFAITKDGHPFVRTLAAHFDAYLGLGKARHSVAV